MNNNDGQQKSGAQKISEKVQDVKKAVETAKKIKKYWPIISAVAPILGWLLLIVIGVIVLMVPIMYVDEIKDKLATGMDKFVNFVKFNGWNTSEGVFVNELQDEYDRYDSFPNKVGEFDIPLIASTVHYKVIIRPDAYAFGDEDDQAYVYDPDNPIIGKKQIRSFYVLAANDLGSAYTLFPNGKGLIGHLIDTRFTTQCVEEPKLLDPSSWKEFGTVVYQNLETIWKHFYRSVGDTTEQLIDRSNLVSLFDLMYSYSQSERSYWSDEVDKLVYGATNDNFILDLIRIIEQSDLTDNCAEGERAMPVISKFINYDYYKEYLKDYYLERQPYAKCVKCEYHTASPDRQDYLLDKWIDEIFDQKDAYNYLQGKPSQGRLTQYIPGMPSLPIQIGAGEDWTNYTTRGYELGDAVCYENGKPTGETNCNHLGIDFGKNVETGNPILAIANGYVIEANYSPSGYGYYAKLGHDIDGDGNYDYYSLYAHMSVLNVVSNMQIGGGQLVGELGSTGNSSGSHLHFELMDANQNKIDPASMLDDIVNGNSALNPISGMMTCNMFTSTEISERNSALAERVKSAGYGTRDGVVAAANYLAVDIGVTIPYWYGGKFTASGINSEWGCSREITADPGTDLQPTGSSHPYGMDCSGFVSWAIRNGGYKASTIKEGSDNQVSFTDDVIAWDVDSINYAKPGDLAWNDTHIGIIIGVDKNSCTYHIAEEQGANSGLVISKSDCTSRRFTNIVLMDDYYDNANNKEG